LIRRSETRLRDACIIVPDVFTDRRGFFKESYSKQKYEAIGITDDFIQDNLSFSVRGTLRGLHGDPRMSKLVQVLDGRVFDVIVDMRRDSPTFGKWEAHELSGDNHLQMYIPHGFAHGFLALTDALFSYKQSAYHDPAQEFAVRYDDPELAIDWPVSGAPLLSEKDRKNPSFADAPKF
jgi:dTDP-4-dehydrorhamnose 3,5-epimerase